MVTSLTAGGRGGANEGGQPREIRSEAKGSKGTKGREKGKGGGVGAGVGAHDQRATLLELLAELELWRWRRKRFCAQAPMSRRAFRGYSAYALRGYGRQRSMRTVAR